LYQPLEQHWTPQSSEGHRISQFLRGKRSLHLGAATPEAKQRNHTVQIEGMAAAVA